MADIRERPNATRYSPGDRGGHYESFFVRANHPRRPLAFWIRYTIFAPARRPDAAVGELWAAWFDGESGRHEALKLERPIRECSFSPDRLDARVGEARLDGEQLAGSIETGARSIAWRLSYRCDQPPLLMFPEAFYERGFPRAKALVGGPLARLSGELTIGDRSVEIDGWIGSQNHNWGSRHTDRYAWGQVAGFDGATYTFTEAATAQIKLGPLWTPRATLVVLREPDREIALNGLIRSMRNRGSYRLFDWTFDASDRRHRVSGRIHADPGAFVGLAYANPPGGTKHCLNSKIAACEITVEDRRSGERRELAVESRAAFEILVEPGEHDLEIRC